MYVQKGAAQNMHIWHNMIEENYIYLGYLRGKLTKRGANVCVSQKMFASNIRNTYLEEMVGNGFNLFVLDINPSLVKLITQDLVNGLHLPSKDQGFIIHR